MTMMNPSTTSSAKHVFVNCHILAPQHLYLGRSGVFDVCWASLLHSLLPANARLTFLPNLGAYLIPLPPLPPRCPPLLVNYHADLAEGTTGREWRQDMKPINITQPEGPSFTITGNLVRSC